MMFLAAAFAAALLAPLAQEPPPEPQQPAVELPTVVVEGRRLEDLVADFVSEAAAPSRGRGLARWNRRVCVGVVNLRREAAQALIDRITDVMLPLGLEPKPPGCRAEAIILFTDDGQALAARLAEEHRRAFRTGGVPGLDRGNAALEAFVASERPVRWWHTSLPVDANTGTRAVRMPGDTDSFGNPVAPILRVLPSRLNSQTRDDLTKALIIVDIDGVADVGLARLADFLAFVSLAQIDMEAEFAGHDTVLAIFEDPEAAPDGLTEWDRSYLTSLYRVLDDPQRPRNPDAVTGRVADAMTQDRTSAQDGPEE